MVVGQGWIFKIIGFDMVRQGFNEGILNEEIFLWRNLIALFKLLINVAGLVYSGDLPMAEQLGQSTEENLQPDTHANIVQY